MRGMPSQSSDPDLPSASALRASLLGAPDTAAGELDRWRQLSAAPAAYSATAARLVPAPVPPVLRTPGLTPVTVDAARPLSPPSPDEVLGSSPAVVRLCESYHRSLSTMLQRSRRQRIGIFCLVAALGLGAAMLSRSGTVTAELVSDLVLAAAGSSAASLALLAMLWMRDQRQLRMLQGQRLLRALQSSCTLPPERLSLLRSSREPVATFFECYASWRTRHQEPQSRLALLVATFRGTNRASTA